MRSVLIVAGELSGDLQGGYLVRKIREKAPEVSFFGLGGDNMASAGVEIIEDISNLAFMGFAEVVQHLPHILRVKRELLRIIDSREVSAAVLIDYPGFNLSLANSLKKRKIPVIYYISPQVWAWGRRRIKKIKRLVKKMLVVLPFEEPLYRGAGVPVEFVGHPFLDFVKPHLSEDGFRKRFNLQGRYVAVLPGSRQQEITRHLPLMLSAFSLFNRDKDFQIVIARAPHISKQIYTEAIEKAKLSSVATVVDRFVWDVVNYSEFAVVSSGSATLECAVLGTAMIIVYRTSWLTYHLIRALSDIQFIGLANFVYGKKVIPELIQGNFTAENLSLYMERMLDIRYRKEMLLHLSVIKERLGTPGAVERAAQIIIGELNER